MTQKGVDMRGIGRAIAALAMLAGALPAVAGQQAAAETHYVPTLEALTIYGKGYGHGRGMSQYGAQGAALAGLTSTQILNFYYPGTTTATTSGYARVWITADTSPGIYIRAGAGLRARSLSTNTAWALPVSSTISAWIMSAYGEHQTRVFYYRTTTRTWVLWKTLAGMGQFEGQYEGSVVNLVLPNGSIVPYRGRLRTADRPGTDLDTINVLTMEYYLRGVVPKEVITSWKPAALQAQSVAARTYAARKRSQSTGADYDLCDTTACQVYGGYAAEVPSASNAVVATSNQIRMYAGSPILAEFSSSNGGHSAPGGTTYLPAKPDPYDAYPGNGNPNSDWAHSSSDSVAGHQLGVGDLRQVNVLQRDGYGTWGGRVLSAEVVGTTATKTYSGDELRTRLGLKSTWITFGQSMITKHWVAIGGAASPVGSPVWYELPVPGGAGQEFAAGHIYWNPYYGAWEVYGGFGTRYQELGGPVHAIGLPIGARFNGAVAGSLVQRFRNGRMFYAAATGVREVYGRVYTAYYGVGLEGGRLGLPTTYQYLVQFTMTSGAQQRFQGGYVNWYASNNTTAVVYT